MLLLLLALVQTGTDSLRQLDSAWARSYATSDTALANRLFDDSLIVTSGNGRLKDKGGPLGWRMVTLHIGPAPEP